jgi:hypothetical protein
MNIELLLAQKGIIPKDKGSNLIIKCLNPAHPDKNPSMSIEKSTGRFHCFACGFGGSYSKLHEILTGEHYKKTVNDTWGNPFLKRQEPPLEPSIDVLGNLYDPKENPLVRSYLKSVGILKDSFIDKYEIKYTYYCEMLASHLKDTPKVFPTKMENRACLPIYSPKNNCINYECRDFLLNNPKNKKILYAKGGSVATLYNWQFIDKTKPVITTESVKNFWKIWNVYPNTLAFFHAIPSELQISLLKELKGGIIHFGDNDAGFFGEVTNGLQRKGTIQVLSEKYGDDFKICWDKRVKKIKTKEGVKIKGYDPNDCSLSEIYNIVTNAIDYKDWKKQT